ncbi:MAG TPA: hypothetical protein VGB87_11860 [Vicinamibacteria bacterium]
MKHLVDADVLSEPTRVAPTPSVAACLTRNVGDFEKAGCPVVDPFVA